MFKKRSILIGMVRRRADRNTGAAVKTGAGYLKFRLPVHPHADPGGYVLAHRVIMERHLGRTLLPTEVVHHINGDRSDNRIENLMKFDTNASHMGFHRDTRPVKVKET
jgi:hypothetical protein